MNELILPLLKMDLDIHTTKRDEYLNTLILSAKEFIEEEGITLGQSYGDTLLIEMYAAYLYRKRKENVAMPRMLRYALNNRLLGGDEQC